jgi:hypothetical protein
MTEAAPRGPENAKSRLPWADGLLAVRGLAIEPADRGRLDQFLTVMQEISERFSVRQTASA